MKKIMFDDKYGLTKAVLEGRKTMTRRLPNKAWRDIMPGLAGEDLSHASTPFKVGEVVAVAQSYKDAGIDPRMEITHTKWVKSIRKYRAPRTLKFTKNCAKDDFGWENKMYVKADLMPHQIRITDVRVERLQDISDEDCVREGIQWANGGFYSYYNHLTGARLWISGKSPKKAFAALIDKISGEGTFESNPWVFVYEFELVK